MYGEVLFALEKCDCQPSKCQKKVDSLIRVKFSERAYNHQNDEPRVHMLLERGLPLSHT